MTPSNASYIRDILLSISKQCFEHEVIITGINPS